KTGTLTEGRPEVIDVIAAPGVEPRDLLAAGAAVEAHSEHPLARAVVKRAQQDGLPLANVADFQSTTGGGVTGRIDHAIVRVGKLSLHRDNGVNAPDELRTTAEALEQKARTVIWVSRDARLLGLLGIADPIKPSTPAALRTLHE